MNLYPRARSYTHVIRDAYQVVLAESQPLDLTLKAFFAQNKKYGSRDRRFIYEALYALFRWKGWLGELLDQPMDKEEAMDNPAFLTAIASALHFDQNTTNPELAAFLLETSGLDLAQAGQTEDLVPAWVLEQIPSESQADFLTAQQTRPPVWLRIQNGQHESVLAELNELKAEPVVHPQLPNAICIDGARLNLTATQSFRQGHFEIQDLASQCLGMVCQAHKAQRWWDACAGGGGKTMFLADAMNGTGQVVISDIRFPKLKEAHKRAERAGFHNVTIAKASKAATMSFDGILVDAPCSLSGTWRRNPESRWITQANEPSIKSRLQLKILDQVQDSLKIGCALVYTTCSVSQIENENVVEQFLTQHPHFALDPITHPFSQESVDTLRIPSLPENCDAMFAARFKRIH